jgi:GNT-I family
MQLAVDFFPFFRRTAQLLDEDPTLYCVSSWNDNGQVGLDTLQATAIAAPLVQSCIAR